MNKLLTALALTLTVALPVVASAAEMRTTKLTKDFYGVYISGDIVDGDYKQFERLTSRLPNGRILVSLRSDGGMILDGLMIGELIRAKRMGTIVFDQCASVCGLMWLAGVSRTASTKASIGFHGAYDGDTKAATSTGNALVGAYLMRLGYNYSTIIYVTKAAPNDMEWMNGAKASQLGIKFSVFTPKG